MLKFLALAQQLRMSRAEAGLVHRKTRRERRLVDEIANFVVGGDGESPTLPHGFEVAQKKDMSAGRYGDRPAALVGQMGRDLTSNSTKIVTGFFISLRGEPNQSLELVRRRRKTGLLHSQLYVILGLDARTFVPELHGASRHYERTATIRFGYFVDDCTNPATLVEFRRKQLAPVTDLTGPKPCGQLAMPKRVDQETFVTRHFGRRREFLHR